MDQKQLTDRFGRVHDYLRISLIDKCNLRCTYCMPENPDFMSAPHLLSTDEILETAKLFIEEYGINKIRLTGGEPLIHPDFGKIVEELGKTGVRLAVTTNGILLDRYLDVLQAAGLKSINISLDTFRKERFKEITRRDELEVVLENIGRAVDMGFKVKMNMVVMKGVNEDELAEFVGRTQFTDIHVRFIEFMPFDGNRWQWDKVYPLKQILADLAEKFEFDKLEDKPHSTSRAYKVRGYKGTFAIISSVTNPFCDGCNRIRLTADGKIRNCLFGKDEMDIKSAFRSGEDIRPLIEASIAAKHKELGGLPDFEDREALKEAMSERSMVKIGG